MRGRSRRRRPPCRPSATRSGSTCTGPRKGFSTSSTRTWPARFASCPCSVATTRETSPSSPSAGTDARERRRPDHGLVPGHRSRRRRAPLRDGGPRCRLPRRVRAHLHPHHRLRERRRRARHPRTSSGPRRAWLEREGIPESDQRLAFNVDMRYPPGLRDPRDRSTLLAGNGATMLAERFNQLHEQLHGFRMEGSACEIVNLRAIGYGKVPEAAARGRARRRRCLRGRRRRARGLLPGRVAADPDLRRAKLRPGHQVEAPRS